MSSVHLPLWNAVPAEVHLPVEAAPCHVRAGDVFKRIVTDYVNDRTDDGRPVCSKTTSYYTTAYSLTQLTNRKWN